MVSASMPTKMLLGHVFEAVIERRGLSGVRLASSTVTRPGAISFRKVWRVPLHGAVLGPVINDNDSQIGVVGDQDGHERCVR